MRPALGMGLGTGDVAEKLSTESFCLEDPSQMAPASTPSSLRKPSEPGTQAGLLGVKPAGWQQRRGTIGMQCSEWS